MLNMNENSFNPHLSCLTPPLSSLTSHPSSLPPPSPRLLSPSFSLRFFSPLHSPTSLFPLPSCPLSLLPHPFVPHFSFPLSSHHLISPSFTRPFLFLLSPFPSASCLSPAFVRVLRDDIDDDGTELRVTDYIRKAYFDFSRFYKHVTRYSSDRVWGGAKGPLEVTRSGWGYFTFTIKVHFQPWLDMEPIELEHELLFEPGGGRQRFVLKLSEAQTEALNKRSQTEKKAGKNKGSGRMGRQSSSSSSSSSSLSSSSAASSAAQSHSVAGFGRRAPRFQSQWPVRP